MTEKLMQHESGNLERVLIQGDLSGLAEEERMAYYGNVCKSLGLNPLTLPLAFLKLSGRLILYAKKDCTDQLRKLHGVSIVALETSSQDGLFIATAKAHDKHGRSDSDMGFAAVGGLKGENLGNAMLKAVTKAKRRTTLSICGLGMLDETEVEDIPADQRKHVGTPGLKLTETPEVDAELQQKLYESAIKTLNETFAHSASNEQAQAVLTELERHGSDEFNEEVLRDFAYSHNNRDKLTKVRETNWPRWKGMLNPEQVEALKSHMRFLAKFLPDAAAPTTTSSPIKD